MNASLTAPGMDSSAPDSLCPPTAVVLVNWNGWRDAIECLDSLLAHSYPNCHVFVVDNDSRDGSVEQLAAWCSNPIRGADWRTQAGVDRWTDRRQGEPIAYVVSDRIDDVPSLAKVPRQLTVIRSGGNLGFAGGCNVGIRVANADGFAYVWLLNTDTVVHRDALRELIERAVRDNDIGMAGSTIVYYDRPEVVQCLGGARMELATVTSRLIGEGCSANTIPVDGAAVEREMFYVMGASMLVSSRFVREIGLLQEDYFLYYEEIDWAMRARGRFKLGYAPTSRVFHKSGASSSKVLPLFASNLYYRNKIRFVTRFFPEKLGAAKRSLGVDLVRHTLKGRWGHARVLAAALWDAGL